MDIIEELASEPSSIRNRQSFGQYPIDTEKSSSAQEERGQSKKWILYSWGACFGFAICNASISEITL